MPKIENKFSPERESAVKELLKKLYGDLGKFINDLKILRPQLKKEFVVLLESPLPNSQDTIESKLSSIRSVLDCLLYESGDFSLRNSLLANFKTELALLKRKLLALREKFSAHEIQENPSLKIVCDHLDNLIKVNIL